MKTLFLVLFPFLLSAQSVAFMAGVDQATDETAYSFDIGFDKEIDGYRIGASVGSNVDDPYISVGVGTHYAGFDFRLNADHYIRLKENGLPLIFGLSGQVERKVLGDEELGGSVIVKWGFNTKSVFGYFGFKVNIK